MARNSLKARFAFALAILCMGTLIGFTILAIQSSLNSDKAFAENLIRLHVIAHSNSPKDQDLKLVVRDEVLREAGQILGDIDNKERAYELLMKNAERLETRAQEVVARLGFDYPVEVKMGQYVFPYREYASMALPQGTYDAVRVEIGAAAGDNWWCVLFPPLCLAELEGANENLVAIDKEGSSGKRIVLRLKLWEHVVETRYAQALQKWWRASAAGLPALTN